MFSCTVVGLFLTAAFRSTKAKKESLTRRKGALRMFEAVVTINALVQFMTNIKSSAQLLLFCG